MSTKKHLQELIIKYQNIETEITQLKTELTSVVAKLPEVDIEEDVEFFVKLKYNDIKADSPDTWEKIGELPHPVLNRWDQRLWLDKKSRQYGSAEEKELKEKLGDKGFKSVERWLWYTPDYIKSVLCNPGNVSKSLSEIVDYYNKGTVLSKKHIGTYFDMLQEEIRVYENKTNK
jgi:hypothetical protein